MTWYREWFGEEYLELYSYRDEEEARRQVTFFREKVGEIAGTVLDLACGSGRHLIELRDAGYKVVGCDLSYVLLRSGLRQYGSMGVTRADMRMLPFRDATFATLVNFFTSFGYFESEDDNRATVKEMARVLTHGARFLFDYLNVDRELQNLVQKEEKQIELGTVSIERWFDHAARTFNKRISWQDKSFLERVRAYDLEEIEEMFSAAGFSIDEVCGDFDGSAFNSESSRLIVFGTRG